MPDLLYSSDHDGDLQDSNAMGRFGHPSAHKDRSNIDIILDAPYLVLKGTGPDVEPTRLSGNVVLYLTEPTSIKEITLQFRGKARIPVPATESLMNSSTSLTYSVCHHNWSFLEGSAKHTHTLKAGRHFFPFGLEIGGSLPSSISTPAVGSAAVTYKLRALATRPLLAHNLQCVTPITLVRSFAGEALEYQQSLEIENTWPGKVMYSIVLPHKAWAMGDNLGALIKFSPLVKGVTVDSILTNIVETTKVYARSGKQEETRVVASSKHSIINGRAIMVDSNTSYLAIGQASPPACSSPSGEDVPGPSLQFPSTSHLPAPFRPSASRAASYPSEGDWQPAPAPQSRSSLQDESTSDIVTSLFLPVPYTSPAIIPSHSLEPIVVSHRVRWAIYIRNPDRHISELRCSLPITIMDARLLNESKAHTAMTRRSVLSMGLPAGDVANDEYGLAGDSELEGLDNVEDRELPSYTAHVRDRVANMYLSEASTMRVTNPWVVHGTSPTSPMGFVESTTSAFALNEDGPTSPSMNTDDSHGSEGGSTRAGSSTATPSFPPSHSSQSTVYPHQNSVTPPAHISHPPSITHSGSAVTLHSSPPSRAPYSRPSSSHNPFLALAAQPKSHPTSGHATPADPPAPAMSHLPQAPESEENAPLDWITCELMMSLSVEPRQRFGVPGAPSSEASTSSLRESRPMSRAPSPEPRGSPSRPASPVDGEGHAHGKGLGGFFKGAMKGFGFTKHHPHGHTLHGHGHFQPHAHDHGHHHHSGSPSPPASGQVSPPSAGTSMAGDAPTSSGQAGEASSAAATKGVSFSSTDAPSTHSRVILPRPAGALPPQGASSRSSSQLASNVGASTSASASTSTGTGTGTGTAAPPRGPVLLHRAFTEVPDYSIASRGFIGGVPPLSSMVGLPSYEQASKEREQEWRTRRGEEGDRRRSGSEDGDGVEDVGIEIRTRRRRAD